jgi:diguanylate cyclase (GGDEF)-like protein
MNQISPLASASRPSDPQAEKQSIGKLLIVDDLADNREVLTRRFQRRGFEIVEADSGREALRLIAKHSFDCVLLDVMMPGMDGTEVLRQIREKHTASLLPVIMVTAKSQSEDVVEALKLGANDYVTKPVDFAIALARVNGQIERRRQELQNLDRNNSLADEKLTLEQCVSERSAKLFQANAAIQEEVARRVETENRIAFLAHHDTLTGLPNRFTFEEKLRSLQEFNQAFCAQISLLFVDLDGFKNVNDTLGHGVGDELLKEVAGRLVRVVGANDFCARLGGDEFAIVHISDDAAKTAPPLAENIIAAISGGHVIGSNHVFVGASIGVATLAGGEKDTDSLLKRADIAMYRAKAEGRGIFRIYEAEMGARAEKRSQLEGDMRRALESGAFELYYQPIVDLKQRKVRGFEALMRWNHPTRGPVGPSEFIPLAEETGLIVAMGEWALRQACSDAANWPDNLCVAINLSPVQFRNANLLTVVISALASSGLAANRLELEITEGVLLGNSKHNIQILTRLRELGAKISLDYFGTGFSGLGYFRTFQFDKVKIDQSFVREMRKNPESLAIIRAAIGLGENLGICTTAEGVESFDQLDDLLSEGCTEVQGFLFSRAKPNADVLEMIDEIMRLTNPKQQRLRVGYAA